MARSLEDLKASKLYYRLKAMGVDPEDYLRRMAAANGICEACGGYSETLVQDHCHATKKARGLICPGCNLALGHVKDDIERLCNLVEYLEDYEDLHGSDNDPAT